MLKDYVKLKQGNFTMYLVSLSVSDLINSTKVEYYESAKDDGYQRPLIPSHYRKISKYLQTEEKPILPPAILTAVNPEQVNEGAQLAIKGELRVVDGQHRIQGIKYLRDIDIHAFKSIENYEFPVVVMVISNIDKIHEVNTFININSKGKKVSTDLAIQLKERIRREIPQLMFENEGELLASIVTNVTYRINNRKESVWYQAIRLGDDLRKERPISINAFTQSIRDIIQSVILYRKPIKNSSDIEDITEETTTLLIRAWEIVEKRWKECFRDNIDTYNYSIRYNIQKGIGVFSLHKILNELVKTSVGDIEHALNRFKNIVNESRVYSNEWLIGGKFSAFNSRAGFEKIAQHIKNEETELLYEIK